MPITEHYRLPSGRVVRLVMPDLYAILATVGRVPSQQIMDVLDLLIEEGSYKSASDGADHYLSKRTELRGRYAIVALCMDEPKLVLDREPGLGELSASDLTWPDVEAVYYGFFRGWRVSPDAPPESLQPDGAENAPSAGDHVPPAPKPTDQ